MTCETLQSVRDLEMTEAAELGICSKCNTTFGSDSEYMQHYDEKHRPGRTN